LADGSVSAAKLNTTGTANSSTYLRGDMAWSSLPASGKVLQVVSVTKTDTFSASPGLGTFVDITGLTVTITPSSTSSRILILGNVVFSQQSGSISMIRMLRNGSLIDAGAASGSAGQGLQNTSATNENFQTGVPITFVDSPASTSALTYKIQTTTETGYTVWVNRTAGNLNDARQARTASNLIVMEIAG
jgi:hypothetical protein